MTGTLVFEQQDENSPTTITYEIAGNSPNAKRGMHIHTFGDNTNGCTSAGPHFNPHGTNHGDNSADERHVGDLGNIQTDDQGNAKGTIVDKHIPSSGPSASSVAPSSCTPARTTSARAATSSRC